MYTVGARANLTWTSKPPPTSLEFSPPQVSLPRAVRCALGKCSKRVETSAIQPQSSETHPALSREILTSGESGKASQATSKEPVVPQARQPRQPGSQGSQAARQPDSQAARQPGSQAARQLGWPGSGTASMAGEHRQRAYRQTPVPSGRQEGGAGQALWPLCRDQRRGAQRRRGQEGRTRCRLVAYEDAVVLGCRF